MLHRFVRAGIVALFVTVIIAPAAAATGAPGTPPPGGNRGQAAVDALAARLPSVAAQYGMSADDLQQRLTSDHTLRVDPNNRLFYADEKAPEATPVPQSVLPYDEAQTFLLHSKPGSNRTVYLDFNGRTITGTEWNDLYMGSSCYALPYDESGDTATFTTNEKGTIQNIWQRVSEDYAPFDVDVTTEEPPASAITQSGSGDNVFGTVAVFTPESSPCPTGNTIEQATCGSCGGVAYLDVFGYDAFQPALVFNVGAKGAGEAASHEIGHNAGLNHDGVSGGSPYYSGHGPWAPIMGVGYYKPVVQWSKGEYTNANNAEDDLALIAANAAPVRTDDHGNTAGTATTLTPGSPAAGIISTRTDVDAFALTSAGDTFAITANPAPTAPNLDIALEVRDSVGTLVASSDPAVAVLNDDLASGLNASLNLTLPAGTYTVTIDGIGYGTASTAYTDYASLGAYTLNATTTAPPPGAFAKTAPANNATGIALTGTTISWGVATGAVSYEYCADTTLDSTCTGTWTSAGASTSATTGALTAGATYEWQVRAVSGGGTTQADSGTWWRFTTVPPPGAFNKTAPANNATGIALTGTTISWGAATGAVSYEYCADTNLSGSCNTSWVSTGASTSATLPALTGSTTYEWQVRAVNANGATYANTNTWWRFASLGAPGAFNKTAPIKGATNQNPSSLTMQWTAAADATSYEYCIDNTSGSVCTATWVSVGTNTSITLNNLVGAKAYFWHVRAVNAVGTTYANANTWWSFKTIAAPGAFSKKTPGNGVSGVGTSPKLTWATSSRASYYEYCIDTTNNNSCDTGWVNNGNSLTKTLSGLTPGTTYYWHVRATNGAGVKYSNSNAWFRFTT